jgi:hypothetical protein
MQDAPKLLPVFYSADPQVQRYCRSLMLDFDPDTSKTARELCAEARATFGPFRCSGLEFREH